MKLLFETNSQTKDLRIFMTGHRRAVWKDIVFLLSVEEKQPCQTKSYSYHLVRGKMFPIEDQAYEN